MQIFTMYQETRSSLCSFSRIHNIQLHQLLFIYVNTPTGGRIEWTIVSPPTSPPPDPTSDIVGIYIFVTTFSPLSLALESSRPRFQLSHPHLFGANHLTLLRF